MANMTDTGFVAPYINYMFSSATATMAAITGPLKLRLMTAMANGGTGSNVNGTNNTEATSGNCPGYSAGGLTLGSTAFSTFVAATPAAITNNNSVTWTATGSWTPILGAEIWNSNGTPSRQAQGLLTSTISGVSNGDTVQFAASSISLDAVAW